MYEAPEEPSASTKKIMCRRSFFRYTIFRFWMMPASIGCNFDVVFGGRKTTLTFSNSIWGWEPQLSRKSRMCRFCRRIRLSTLRIHAANSSPVIQALLFLELVDLPITRGISFSPEALPHRRIVRRSFDSLPPLHSLATSDLTGNERKMASLIGVEDVLQRIPLALVFQPPRPFLHHLFLHVRRLSAQNRGIYVVADLKPVEQ